MNILKGFDFLTFDLGVAGVKGVEGLGMEGLGMWRCVRSRGLGVSGPRAADRLRLTET